MLIYREVSRLVGYRKHGRMLLQSCPLLAAPKPTTLRSLSPPGNLEERKRVFRFPAVCRHQKPGFSLETRTGSGDSPVA